MKKVPLIYSIKRRVHATLLSLGTGLLLLVAGCGGGGGGGGGGPVGPAAVSSLAPSSSLANLCASPRPSTADMQASLAQEKDYLRSFVDETYLWYQDVPGNLNPASYATAPAYFDVLKTNARTPSGAPLDQFHWSQTTASWNAAQSGLAEDYGIRWAALSNVPPRNWLVADVAPHSAAALAGIRRGDKVTTIDGVDFINDNTTAGVLVLNEGLAPTVLVPHRFGFNGGAEFSLLASTYQLATVQNVQTLATTNGTVGYFIFNSHIAQSEGELIAAINQLKAAQVSDLVIDLRYNGGGLLYIASELAYMVSGPGATNARVFERTIHNDKQATRNTAYPFAFYGTTPIASLPHLDLQHVTVLTTRGTASASESIINSLRGIDVTVDLIGSNTRGKPYGFVPQSNCGTTYFAIQFKGVNDKGFGDYADGFTPTCAAADDYSHARGDTAEGMLAAALSYRQNRVCPPNVTAQVFQAVRPGGMAIAGPVTQALRVLNDPSR